MSSPSSPSSPIPFHIPIDRVHQLTIRSGELSAVAFEHGSLTLRYYSPHEIDRQVPHDLDELYVIISGHGSFEQNGIAHPFQPQDVIFVPAGVAHRFFDFTEDFSTWVMFYGPRGGEILSEGDT